MSNLVWSSTTICAVTNGLDCYGLVSETPAKSNIIVANVPGVPYSKTRLVSFANDDKDTFNFRGITFFTTQYNYWLWKAEIRRHQSDPLAYISDLYYAQPDASANDIRVQNVILSSFEISAPLQNIQPRGSYYYYAEWEATFIKMAKGTDYSV